MMEVHGDTSSRQHITRGYFFLLTSTNTIRMWRIKAPTPVMRNKRIGFICWVSVSTGRLRWTFYQSRGPSGSEALCCCYEMTATAVARIPANRPSMIASASVMIRSTSS